jgi:hypothetical protein
MCMTQEIYLSTRVGVGEAVQSEQCLGKLGKVSDTIEIHAQDNVLGLGANYVAT